MSICVDVHSNNNDAKVRFISFVVYFRNAQTHSRTMCAYVCVHMCEWAFGTFCCVSICLCVRSSMYVCCGCGGGDDDGDGAEDARNKRACTACGWGDDDDDAKRTHELLAWMVGWLAGGENDRRACDELIVACRIGGPASWVESGVESSCCTLRSLLGLVSASERLSVCPAFLQSLRAFVLLLCFYIYLRSMRWQQHVRAGPKETGSSVHESVAQQAGGSEVNMPTALRTILCEDVRMYMLVLLCVHVRYHYHHERVYDGTACNGASSLSLPRFVVK